MKAAAEKTTGTARSSAPGAGSRTASVQTAPVSQTSQATEPARAAVPARAAAAPGTIAAPSAARGLSARSVQRLQSRAGNAAVSRLVAQRYADVVKPPPSQAPGFRKVQQDVAAKKQTLKQHKPAAAESRAAQNAAVAPPDDKEAQGKTANAEKMNDAKPGEFNKAEFVGAVNEAIAAQAPKNLDEADKFAGSGKADNVKNAVDGKVKDGKESSADAIETATTAAPDTSKATDKEVTPLNPDQPPANPGAPSAAAAVPATQPDAVLDFREGNQQVDQHMADAEVTEDQLARGNEPAFDKALSEKKKGEQDTAEAPGKGRAAEAEQLAAAKAGAAASGARAMAAMTADRNVAGKSVDSGKGETKSADEKKREQVTAKLQKVFDTTQKDVEKILKDLDGKVDRQFTEGEKRARDNFTADHKRRMKAYKDKRYSGLMGKGRWVKDKFKGLPQEGLDIFKKSRELYVDQMQTVISAVADMIGTELGRAKARIATGRNELKAEVDRLPADLKKFGEEAAADFAGKFDDLESEVNDKSTQLVQDLAQKYTEALNSVDEEIKKLEEENKGIIAAVMDAVVGVIQTILELKNMLMGVLAKAASAIGKIIKDPIGFLKNLVSALGAGLNLFIANVPDHLQKGLVSWLLGTAVSAGLAIPAKFDLKGIIQLIASLLGLTWDNIRARVTRKGVPDKAMAQVEQSVPVAGALAREGPAGAVNEIKEETGDLKKEILDDLKSYLIPTVLIAGITWILSLLTPASAFARAVKGIIDLVTFIVTQGAQIFEFVNACLDAVIAVANGGSAGVPKTIETALAASIPLLLGLLASLLGIGGLANRVRQAFQKVSRPVNRAIDKLVDKIAKAGKRIWSKLKSKSKRGVGDQNDEKKDQKKNRELPEAIKRAKGVISRNEKNNSPVSVVAEELLALKRVFSWIKGFGVEKREVGFAVSMKASDHPLGQYSDVGSVKAQLDKYGPEFIGKVHKHWWEFQIQKPKIGSSRIWNSEVLDQTKSKAEDYLQQDDTARDVKKQFFEGNRRDVNAAAFYGHVFGVKSGIRRKVVKLLGDSALKELKKQGKKVTRDAPEVHEIVKSMRFHPGRDAYGQYDPFPASPGEREHTNFYPVFTELDESRSNSDMRVTTVRTAAGKTFTITEDLKSGLSMRVKGLNLRLKEPGEPRGVTQDSPGFVPNQRLNRSHVIADMFGGSGYREALNLVTASDHYNQTVMGDAESDIATGILAFAEAHNLARGEVSMDLTVTVTFGELLKDTFMRNIENQEWYKENDPESDAQLARITKILLTPPVRRVMGVIYDFTLTSTVSDVPPERDSRDIQSDDHLFLKRSAS
ncbi:hypothetical protein ACFY7Z_30385 [Streptomyces sp. NPDC012623]|uniref:hypothetical protein n=1 Tax=unclassified Streptomyces TaxID=2593676 RepID=UPI0036B1C01C